LYIERRIAETPIDEERMQERPHETGCILRRSCPRASKILVMRAVSRKPTLTALGMSLKG
jgi:hypothetical protein